MKGHFLLKKICILQLQLFPFASYWVKSWGSKTSPSATFLCKRSIALKNQILSTLTRLQRYEKHRMRRRIDHFVSRVAEAHCLDLNLNDQKTSHLYWYIPGRLRTYTTLFYDLTRDSIANNFVIDFYCRCLEILCQIAINCKI